jgi:predicted AlkP superfamily pyrophosphatase or phosphodiesterase
MGGLKAQTTQRVLLSLSFVLLLVLAYMIQQDWLRRQPVNAKPFYVIHISIDGLGSHQLEGFLARDQVPNLERLIREGLSTLNARTDHNWTITLPNHVSQLTGRPVQDKYYELNSGHRWNTNLTPEPGVTLHSNRGFYLASTFDVAHDNGLSTALYSSKDKFVLFDESYNAIHGAPDVVGEDNGRDKIDVSVITDVNDEALFNAFKWNMRDNPTRYTFVHFAGADHAGHWHNWGSPEYNAAVVLIDHLLGRMLALIDSVPAMQGKTYIVLTADHGGIDNDHQANRVAEIFTVPFIIWGAGIPAGADLYQLNGANTFDPGTSRREYSHYEPQPVRNGDAGNCALSLLGLPAIPGSSLDHLRKACQSL